VSESRGRSVARGSSTARCYLAGRTRCGPLSRAGKPEGSDLFASWPLVNTTLGPQQNQLLGPVHARSRQLAVQRRLPGWRGLTPVAHGATKRYRAWWPGDRIGGGAPRSGTVVSAQACIRLLRDEVPC